MLKRLTWLTISTCLLLATAAQTAHAEEGEEEARVAKVKEAKEQATHAELKRFIDELYAAIRLDPQAAGYRYVDREAFAKRTGRHLGDIGGTLSETIALSLRIAAPRIISQPMQFEGLTSATVRRIEALDGTVGQRFRIVVYETYDGYGVWTGWYVHRVGDGWGVVDMDSIDVGLVVSEATALALRAVQGRGSVDGAARKLFAAARSFEAAFEYVMQDDLEAAGKKILEIEGDDHLPIFLYVRALIVGMRDAGRMDTESARRWIDEAIRLRPLAPVGYGLRAQVASLDDSWQEALDAGRRHHDLLGPDPEIDLVRARAHLELNEPKLAYPLALRASEITKGDYDLLWVLLGSAPEEQRAAALAAGLAGFDDKVDALRSAADWLHAREIPTATDWVLSEIKRRSPADWFLEWHAGRLLLDEVKYDQAWPKLANSFRAMGDPGWREAFYDVLVDAGLGAGKLPELWQVFRPFETERDAWFEWVVFELEDPEQVAELRVFIDAATPDRDGLPSFEGALATLLLNEKAYDQAIELLLPTWERMDKEFRDAGGRPGDDVDVLRGRLHELEYRLFRAALRGQRRDLTLRLARRAVARDDEMSYLVRHYVAAGDTAAALRALNTIKDQREALVVLWIDEDLGPVFRKPPYLPIFAPHDLPDMDSDDE